MGNIQTSLGTLEPPQNGVLNYMAVMNIGVCFLFMYISGQLQQRVDSTIGVGNDCIVLSQLFIITVTVHAAFSSCRCFFFFSVLSQL